MTLVNHETGELVEPLSRTDAERLTTRIRLRLDTIADNYTAVMPLIREAIERQAYAALGYTGVSQYVSECFGDALSKLNVEVRREVVRELTEAGMSTRAIAPVVGVSHMTVKRDTETPVTPVTPQTPAPQEDDDDAALAEQYDRERGYDRPREERAADARRIAAVNGLDGKTYARPAPAAPRRSPLTDTARALGLDLSKITGRLERLAADDRFGQNRNEVAAHLRHHLDHALKVLADLDAEINSQEGA